jgi:hypothetical protein
MIYGKLPVTFLSTVASEKRGSINSVIAGYILSHLSEMRGLGIQEVAKACHVSTASLSRFCKEIGLQDFSELKELLEHPHFSFQKQASSSVCSEHICQSIQTAERTVDVKGLRDLCRDIHTFSNVAAFGLLKAGAAAVNLQGDFLMLGKQIYTNVSYPQQIQYIKSSSPEDLIILFSYTGSYFDNLERSIHAKGKIWMLSGQQRDYPKCVSRSLHFSSDHSQIGHPYQLLFLSTLIAQEYANMYQKYSAS